MNTAVLLGLVGLLADASFAYPATADELKCRSGPSTDNAIVRMYNMTDDVKLECQLEGQDIFGTTIWDYTTDGCYVSDYYIETGSSDYVMPKCETGPPVDCNNACTDLNAAGIALIKRWEGFVSAPAPDPVGLPTVGYGHLCQQTDCAEVSFSFPLTEETATQLLKQDIPTYTRCLAATLVGSITLNQNQFAALASFTFNMGCGAMRDSAIIDRINTGEDPATVVKDEFPKWVHATQDGETIVLPGLVNRRNSEIELFTTPDDKQAFPKCA